MFPHCARRAIGTVEKNFPEYGGIITKKIKKSELYGKALMYIMKYIREAEFADDDETIIEVIKLLHDQRSYQLWSEEQEEKRAREAVEASER